MTVAEAVQQLDDMAINEYQEDRQAVVIVRERIADLEAEVGRQTQQTIADERYVADRLLRILGRTPADPCRSVGLLLDDVGGEVERLRDIAARIRDTASPPENVGGDEFVRIPYGIWKDAAKAAEEKR